MAHAPAAERQGCGENLAWFRGVNRNASDTALVQKSCDNWYNEIQYYNWQTGGKLRADKAIGHFTQVSPLYIFLAQKIISKSQLVWKTSTKLGIGIAHDGDETYVVARYSPRKFYQNFCTFINIQKF